MTARESQADPPAAAPAPAGWSPAFAFELSSALPPLGVPLWRAAAPAGPAFPAGSAGMVVARDPVTGELMPPTPEQMKKFALEFAPRPLALPPLPETYLPDGSVLVHLDGRFDNYAVARRDAAGAVRFDCVQGESAAERVLDAPPAPAPGAPVEE